MQPDVETAQDPTTFEHGSGVQDLAFFEGPRDAEGSLGWDGSSERGQCSFRVQLS